MMQLVCRKEGGIFFTIDAMVSRWRRANEERNKAAPAFLQQGDVFQVALRRVNSAFQADQEFASFLSTFNGSLGKRGYLIKRMQVKLPL